MELSLFIKLKCCISPFNWLKSQIKDIFNVMLHSLNFKISVIPHWDIVFFLVPFKNYLPQNFDSAQLGGLLNIFELPLLLSCRKSLLQIDVILHFGFAKNEVMFCTWRTKYCAMLQPHRQLKWQKETSGQYWNKIIRTHQSLLCKYNNKLELTGVLL